MAAGESCSWRANDDGAAEAVRALAEDLGFSPIKVGDCLRRRGKIAETLIFKDSDRHRHRRQFRSRLCLRERVARGVSALARHHRLPRSGTRAERDRDAEQVRGTRREGRGDVSRSRIACIDPLLRGQTGRQIENGRSPSAARPRLQCRRAGRKDVHGRRLRDHFRGRSSGALTARQPALASDDKSGRIAVVASGVHDPAELARCRPAQVCPCPPGTRRRRWLRANSARQQRTTTPGQTVVGATRPRNSPTSITYGLAPRLPAGITVNAFDPGLMPGTGLARDYPAVGSLCMARDPSKIDPIAAIDPGGEHPHARGVRLGPWRGSSLTRRLLRRTENISRAYAKFRLRLNRMTRDEHRSFG